MKLAIASILIALMFALAVAAAKKIKQAPRKSASEEKSVVASETELSTTLDLVNFAGFDGPCAVATDGTRVLFVGIQGKNLSFATPLEKDADAEGVSIALASVRRPYRIHRCQRPIDTTVHVEHLRDQVRAIDDEISKIRAGESGLTGFAAEKALSAHIARRSLIEEIYLPQAQMTGAPKFETDIYVTFGFDEAKGVAARAVEEANAFITQMTAAGYVAKILRPKEITERLINYWGRFPVAAENINAYDDHDLGVYVA